MRRVFFVFAALYIYTLVLCFLWYKVGEQHGYTRGFQQGHGALDDDKCSG